MTDTINPGIFRTHEFNYLREEAIQLKRETESYAFISFFKIIGRWFSGSASPYERRKRIITNLQTVVTQINRELNNSGLNHLDPVDLQNTSCCILQQKLAVITAARKAKKNIQEILDIIGNTSLSNVDLETPYQKLAGAVATRRPTERTLADPSLLGDNGADRVRHHRFPDRVNPDAWNTRSMSKRQKKVLKGKIAQFEKTQGKKPSLCERQRLAHSANLEVYKEMIGENTRMGLYDLRSIPIEMLSVLHIDDKIALHDVGSRETALAAINREIDQLSDLRGSEKSSRRRQGLTEEQRNFLQTDIERIYSLHEECYPEISIEKRYVFCRDIARIAIYQTFFDRRMLTGSDHGVLHAHGNCKSSDSLHQSMDQDDMPPLGKLLAMVIHYYHDIGYSVGGSATKYGGFAVMKDHPYIGAKFIDDHRAYFDHYLPPVRGGQSAALPEKFGEISPSEILRNTILHHASISFDSDPNDLQRMVIYSVTNSDACAVGMHNKSQQIWRNHPEAIVELSRLRKFIALFPEYGGFQKLEHDDVATHPWKVFPLKKAFANENERRAAMEDPNNFEDPLDGYAFKLYCRVKQNLMSIICKAGLSEEEKAHYLGTIDRYLTGVGAKIVVGQYGVQVDSVTSTKRLAEANSPKYRPSVLVRATAGASSAEHAISPGDVRKNVIKLGEEYGLDKEKVALGLDMVSETGIRQTIESDVARVVIAPPSKSSSDYPERVFELLQSRSGPKGVRKQLTRVAKAIDALPEEANASNLADELITLLDNRPLIRDMAEALQKELLSEDAPNKKAMHGLVRGIRMALITDAEWRFMFGKDVERPCIHDESIRT